MFYTLNMYPHTSTPTDIHMLNKTHNLYRVRIVAEIQFCDENTTNKNFKCTQNRHGQRSYSTKVNKIIHTIR